MTKVPISVAMIAGAEAHRIAATLASVREWVSEVVVVINEDAADGTDRIAAEQGARVFREPWKGHVRQKNSALEKAGQPWVLGLDSDEVVTPALRESILGLFAEPSRMEGFAAWSFARRTWYGGRWILHGDWYPDLQTRLWRRGAAKWGGIDPHDRLEVDGRVGRLAGDLEHRSYAGVDDHVRKLLRYADDFARECGVRGRGVGRGDLVFRPVWRFLRCYVLRRGFLDGWAGFDVAWMSAFYTYLRYRKAVEAAEASGHGRPRAGAVMASDAKERIS